MSFKHSDPNFKKSILFIGAHPDDIELGCAMTVNKYVSEDCRVNFIVCTNGEKSSIGNLERRIVESKSASECQKITNYINLGLPDTHLSFEPELTSILEKAVNSLNPDIIYTHSPKDRHKDHIAVYESSTVAGRTVNEILLYPGPSSFSSFSPIEFYLYKQENMDYAVEVLNHFESQINSGIIDVDAIIGRARYYASLAKSHNHSEHKFAEGFEILKKVYFQ